MLLLISNIFIFIFALFTVLPLLLTLVARMVTLGKGDDFTSETKEPDFACVITAYKEIDCSRNLVLSLLQQNYSHFHVYLLADDCHVSDWNIQHPKFTLLQPTEVLHSKVKSIRYCLDRFIRKHPYFIVFDPDNLAHPDFLSQMGLWHSKGFEIVQGKRTAKNLDTKYACLDAFSEYFYNYAHRTVTFRLGSSATIAGSGMSIPVDFYYQFLKEKFDTQQGTMVIAEDKMLQVYVVEQGYRIAYADHALVFDEKVSTAHQVKRQRTRWITSYFQYLLTSSKLLVTSFVSFNWNKLLFAYTLIIPPMFLIGLTWLLGSLLFIFTNLTLFFLLQVCAGAFVLNIFLALLFDKAPTKVILSLIYAPFFVLNQVKALFSMKDTKTSFLTTEKTKNLSLEEVMNPKPH
jgi:cellulose synthase/poly-beta-1,6-N-acetylglucosamine synthase-like glycosyltransferase